MSDSERRSILSRVAEGTLDPEQAAELLSQLESDRGADSGGSSSSAGGTRGLPPGETARKVRITGSIRSIEVVGDPTVAEAVVEGPHDARREGALLVVEAEGPDVEWSQPGWRWNWNWTGTEEPETAEERRPRYVGYHSEHGWSYGRPRQAKRGTGNRRIQTLKVRVNPALDLELAIKAGAMSVRNVAGAITAECDAGSLQIRNFTGALNATVNAGKLEATGRITRGEHRIEANAAKVDLRLESGSSVEIHARSELSRVSLPAGEQTEGTSGLLAGNQRAVVGAGAGRLDLSVSVGAASVSVD
jgi:hypothetical protein